MISSKRIIIPSSNVSVGSPRHMLDLESSILAEDAKQAIRLTIMDIGPTN